MTFFKFIFQDWDANRGNAKGRFVLTLFRMANFCTKRKVYYVLGFFYLIFYRFFVEFLLSIEIPWNTKIGKGLCLLHGQALVINNLAVIGEYCTLRQTTTIGNKQTKGGGFTASPVIGNYVDIGSNTCIIGEVSVGDHTAIACGSLVIKNLRAHSRVGGNPAVEVLH